MGMLSSELHGLARLWFAWVNRNQIALWDLRGSNGGVAPAVKILLGL